jgi:hypothetical protein
MRGGFAAAKIPGENVRRAGSKPRHEKIQATPEGLRQLAIGGLEVRYSHQVLAGPDPPICPSLALKENSGAEVSIRHLQA